MVSSGMTNSLPGAYFFDEVTHQEGDVLHSLAQGRQFDADDVDAVEEIRAEPAGLHLVLQIAVGQGDQAHVDLAALVASDPEEGAVLKHPQQTNLQARGHAGDLVQQDGAPVGGLEMSEPLVRGAGEGALLVAEDLAFEKRFGQGAAVDLHVDLVRPRGVALDGIGDQFLAGAALALDEDRGLAAGDLTDLLEDLLHAPGRAR